MLASNLGGRHSFRERNDPQLLQVPLQRLVLRSVPLCQKFIYVDSRGTAPRRRVGLVANPQSFGIGIISHEIPAIAVRVRVDQKIFSHEHSRLNLSETKRANEWRGSATSSVGKT